MFPIIINDIQEEHPTTGDYYVVASNGIFLHKDLGVITGFVPVNNIEILEDFQPGIFRHNLPKLPAHQVAQIKNFFQQVWERYHSESCVLLYLDKEKTTFSIIVPPQKVSYTSVQYEIPRISGLFLIGTIHSHCDFDAFHSGVDEADEKHLDGFHCTLGHVHNDEFSVTASLVLNGIRQKIDPTTVFEVTQTEKGFRLLNPDSWSGIPPSSWLDKVSTR